MEYWSDMLREEAKSSGEETKSSDVHFTVYNTDFSLTCDIFSKLSDRAGVGLWD